MHLREKRIKMALRLSPLEAAGRRVSSQLLRASKSCSCSTGNWPDRRDKLLHLARITVAVKGQVATGGQRPLCPVTDLSAEGLHRQIVRHENAVEADFSTDDLFNHPPR